MTKNETTTVQNRCNIAHRAAATGGEAAPVGGLIVASAEEDSSGNLTVANSAGTPRNTKMATKSVSCCRRRPQITGQLEKQEEDHQRGIPGRDAEFEEADTSPEAPRQQGWDDQEKTQAASFP